MSCDSLQAFNRVPSAMVSVYNPATATLIIAATMVIGLLVNDTGVAIPPVALALVLPLLVSAGIRTWDLDVNENTMMTRG